MASTSETPTLRLWRLVKERHAETAFDGEGARLHGGRWNSPGHRVVYTSESLALAALETLVHLDSALPLPRFIAFALRISASDLELCGLPPLPPLPDLLHTRKLGDDWLAHGRTLAFAVPSTLVPMEKNYLLNPAHPRFTELVIEPPIPFVLDQRFGASFRATPKTKP